MKPKFALITFAALGASLLVPTAANGQTFVWDGGGGDDNFGTGANWSGDAAPSTGGAVVLQFTGSTRTTPYNNYNTGDDFGELRLLNTAGADFTITGNAFGLYSKIENDAGSGRLLTINTAAIHTRDGSIEINPVGGNIAVGAAVELNGNASLNVYDGNNGRTLTINGVLSNGDGSGGSGSLVLNQTSTVVLAADGNDYGTTTINTNTKLQVGNGGATGSLGSGGVTNDGQLVFNRTADLTVSNAISGSGSLAKQGSNVLTLSGASNYSGKTIVNGGTLSISAENNLGSVPGAYAADQLSLNASTLKATGAGLNISANRGITVSGVTTFDNSAMGNGANLNLNSKITGTGNVILKANGDTSDSGGGVGGNLTLGSGSNDFVGNVTIQSGVVNFASDASFGNAANTITIQGGGLVCTAASNSLAASRSIILSGGGNKIFRAYGSSTFTVNGAISGSGNVRHTDGGTLVLSGANSFTGNVDNVKGNMTLGNSAHVGNVINYAGTLVMNGGNTFTGYTNLQNSTTLRLDANHSMPDGGALVLWGGTTFNVNGKTETIGSLTTGSSGDTNVTVNLGTGANLTVTNNSLPAGTTSGYGNATVHGKITGTGNITYAHATTSNALWDWYNTTNDFTGNVTVSQGRLRVASDAVLGNTANDLVFNGDIVTTLGNQQGKASIQVASGANLTFGAGRDIVLNAGKEGTMYAWGSYTMTVNGKVTGGGNLRKEDGGTLLLNNAANDWSGETKIVQGTLQIGASGAFSPNTTKLTVGTLDNATATLNLNGYAASVVELSGGGYTNGVITGGATLNVTGSGAYDYSGRVTDTGGGTTVRYNGAGSLTLSGTTDNSGGRAVVNNGVLVLGKISSSSVHAVGTNNVIALSITGGTARLGGTGGDQIYTDSLVDMTGGTFDLNQRNEGFRALTGTGGNVRNDGASASILTLGESTTALQSYSFAGSITDGASGVGLAKTGLGTQTLTGSNTYTGNTSVNSGTLAVGSGGSISGSSTIAIAANATLDVSATGGWTLGAAQTLTGNGTLLGNTSIAGDLRVGSSPGALTVTGDLGLNSGSDWFVELGGTGAPDFDRLLVSGALSANGNILVSLYNGYTPAANDSFQIATFGSYSGAPTFDFSSAPLGAGLSWDTSRFSTNGTIGVVPEPVSAAFLALGSLGLALHRRR